MDDLVNRILLMTVVLCISWNYSESYTLDYETYVGHNNETLLARYKRQIQGQAYNGGINKFQCATTPDCIDHELKCNGKEDCPDGSDEKESLCKNIPKKCTTPPQLSHGHWAYASDGTKGAGNQEVSVGTVITFSCDRGYTLSSTNDEILTASCMPESTWNTTTPVCQQLCPFVYNTPLVTVKCKNDGSIVPCDKATDDTILTYKCAPYHEAPFGRPEKSICYDGSWDYTPECIPVCGEKRVSATPLIVNGREIERGNYPWVVALYKNKEDDPNYTNICGGSLLTLSIVITAAHCVSNQNNGKANPAKFYRVGAGKYYNKYNDARDNDTAQYADVAEILINREYKGEVQNFRGDIALLRLKSQFSLSNVVQPVCYNNVQFIPPSSLGVITGWGFTTSTGTPSEVLKELELPYNDDDNQCESELDPEFGSRYLTSDKLCADFYNQNTSVCKENGGSGLVFKNPSYKNRFFIHGIVSVAHSFAENSQVHCNIQRNALFTRVENYIEWIQLTVQRWSRNVLQTR